MKEKSVATTVTTSVLETDYGRGTVKDNALKAVVTSSLFRCRVENVKKGKGSYTRKEKFKGKEPYAKMMDFIAFA